MNQEVESTVKKFIEGLSTPKELDEKKILSLVQQWKERERGRLKCYKIGRKILYGEQHLADFFALCESELQIGKRKERYKNFNND